MKKFCIRLIIFLLPLLSAAVLADFIVSKQLRKLHNHVAGEFEVWNDIFDGKINSDVVVYGSSRAWVHINPQMLSDSLKVSAYNLGIDGHNFWLQYLRHKFLLKHNSPPKLIIHSVDIFTLQKREDLFNSDQFLPYMLFNKEIREATDDYQGFNHFDYHLPLVRYYGNYTAILKAFKHSSKPNDSFKRVKGYQGQEKVWNSDFDDAKQKMDYYEVKLDTPSIQLFEKFLAEAKNSNTQVVLVYTPEYTEGQSFVKNREEVISIYEYFSNKYQIPFLDYSKDPISYQKDLFYNSSHLNKKGAELFTKKLVGELKARRNSFFISSNREEKFFASNNIID